MQRHGTLLIAFTTILNGFYSAGLIAGLTVGCGRTTLFQVPDASAPDASTSDAAMPDGAASDAAAMDDAGSVAECQTDADCSNGLFCDGAERCRDGRCTPGAAVVCDDSVPCTEDRCVNASSSCEFVPGPSCPAGTLCDAQDGCVAIACTNDDGCQDGFFCNGAERCVSGQCEPGQGPSCDDGVACTVDECSEVLGACAATPSDAACDDGAFCNGQEVCDPTLDCQPGTPVGCDDGIACTLDRCDEASRGCVSTIVDGDLDTFISTVCGGDDCDDANAAVNPGATEQCADNLDNDCDGTIDCGDPDCTNAPNCCTPSPEVCRNGVDDDCDAQADCADTDCSADPVCGGCTSAEVCRNGFDDDCDGALDCDDPDCRLSGQCSVCQPVETDCNNGFDEDCNGLVDCGDPACATEDICVTGCAAEETGLACRNGRDDDCDGAFDCDDSACRGQPVCQVCFPVEFCDTRVDNDCDGLVDCDDPDCQTSPACGGAPENRRTACTDGLDNDRDGLVDCADPDCAPFATSLGECCNGLDDNGNGQIDEFACSCSTDADCPAGASTAVCWNASFALCAPSCAELGGDLFCQVVSPSLRCDGRQCAFP